MQQYANVASCCASLLRCFATIGLNVMKLFRKSCLFAALDLTLRSLGVSSLWILTIWKLQRRHLFCLAWSRRRWLLVFRVRFRMYWWSSEIVSLVPLKCKSFWHLLTFACRGNTWSVVLNVPILIQKESFPCSAVVPRKGKATRFLLPSSLCFWFAVTWSERYRQSAVACVPIVTSFVFPNWTDVRHSTRIRII